MRPEGFEAMLREFQLFPDILQIHSARQHVQISLSRRGGIKRLTYAAFIECLCRVAFVYLCIYGNSAQQNVPSKHKCIWLLALLRARCEDLGLEKLKGGFSCGPQLAKGGAGAGAHAEESLWLKRQDVNVDTLPLPRLVLWRALDADLAPQ